MPDENGVVNTDPGGTTDGDAATHGERVAKLRDSGGKATLAGMMPSRRALLVGGGVTAALIVGWAVWPRNYLAPHTLAPGEVDFGPFLKLGSDGHVAVVVPQTDSGQGQLTLYAQIIADELGADWRTVSVEPALPAAAYANAAPFERDAAMATPRFLVPKGLETAGFWYHTRIGKSADAMLTDDALYLSDFDEALRAAAASARALLCMAAADRWNVDWESCDVAEGFVTNGTRKLRFGGLVAAAAGFSPPRYPPVRAPGSGALFGKTMPRIDTPSKIDGTLTFAGDVRLPDMAYAAIRQGPHGDTRLKSYSGKAGQAIPGFLGAVRHDRWLAAVASNSWAAYRALDAMAPVFTTEGQRPDSAVIDRRLKKALRDPDGARIAEQGSVSDAFTGRPVLSAEYAVAPALHATLEPPCATAAFDGTQLRLWVSSDAPGACRAAVAAALDLDTAAITLFVMPGGGSFGARMEHDVAIQAALIARSMRRPIQLSWSRTETILRDLPRAPVRATMNASLSTGATVDAWHAAIATAPARHEWRSRLLGSKADAAMRAHVGAVDAAAVEGAVPPYQIPHYAIDHVTVDTALPAGRWRGRATAYTTFFNECFIDELARAAGADPLTFRMTMMGENPELAACLQSVATRGEWDGGTPGSGQGVAVAVVDGCAIAVMALARTGGDGLIIDRIWASANVGRVLNPDITKQQIEAGVAMGVALAVGGTTRYHKGLAEARHWRDLGMPTLAQMPQIDVELLPSDGEYRGIGGVGMAAVAPAIANAVYTVSGERFRRLPLSTKPL